MLRLAGSEEMRKLLVSEHVYQMKVVVALRSQGKHQFEAVVQILQRPVQDGERPGLDSRVD